MNVICFENVNVKVFNKILLNNINFELEKGSLLNIIGNNGSGKTTLIKSLLKLISISKGDIFINNKSITKYNNKVLAKQMAYVPQFNDSKFLNNMTVFKYILTGRFSYINRFIGYKKDDFDKVNFIISKLKLESLKDRKISFLCGGEYQKVRLATALVQETDILLFDEIYNFLDVEHQFIILDIIKDILFNLKKTIISVTHNINDLLIKDSYVLALKNSEQIYFGKTNQFLEKNYTEKIFNIRYIKKFIPEINREILIPLDNK